MSGVFCAPTRMRARLKRVRGALLVGPGLVRRVLRVHRGVCLSWGYCLTRSCDFDGSGAVDIIDLLKLLANWG